MESTKTTEQTFCLVMSDDARKAAENSGHVSPGADGREYVGLRKFLENAIERCQLTAGAQLAGTHWLLRLTFTTEGLARYCTVCTGHSQRYVPRLAKHMFADSATDWEVWHFTGELPLKQPDLIRIEWEAIQPGLLDLIRKEWEADHLREMFQAHLEGPLPMTPGAPVEEANTAECSREPFSKRRRL